MANKYKKFVASAATATLVASAIVPVASANETVKFSDVKDSSEYAQYIYDLSEKKVMTGNGDKFNPSGEVTRTAAVKTLGKWLVNVHGYEIPADWNTKARFNDVAVDSKDEELVKYAALLKDLGIFTGNEAGNLNAKNTLNREQMAKVVVEAYSVIEGVKVVDLVADFESSLKDLSSVSPGNVDYVKVFEKYGITTVDTFNPKGKMQRQHFAKFLSISINSEALAKDTATLADPVVAALTAVEKAVKALPKVEEVTVETAEAATKAVEAVTTAVEAATKVIADAELTAEEKTAAEKTLADATAAAKLVADKVAEVTNKVAVASVAAINENTVSVTFAEGTKIEDADLKGKTITLTNGETVLTATYAAASLSGSVAVFELAEGTKLVDAAEYTVAADWASIKEAKFVAEIGTAYAKTFKAVTTKVFAGAKGTVYVKGFDQYGEEIDVPTTVSFEGSTLNGMPLNDKDLEITKNVITLDKAIKAGDKVVIKISNIVDKETLGSATFEYTVEKAPEGVDHTAPNSIEKIEAIGADDKVVSKFAATDLVTLKATVLDLASNPVDKTTENAVRWVVKEGKDLLEETTTSLTLLGKDKATVDLKVEEKPTFKIKSQGTIVVEAYNISNGAKATYTITAGAQELKTLTFTEKEKTGNNKEEIILGKVEANTGAALAATDLKFRVVDAKGEATTKASVKAVVAGEKDPSTYEKGTVYLVATTTEKGSYSVVPYVGTSVEDTKAVKVQTPITFTTDFNTTAVAIADINTSTLKVGTPVTSELKVTNKHGENIVSKLDLNGDPAVTATVYQDGKKVEDKVEVKFAYNTEKEIGEVKLTAKEKGTYTVRLAVEGTAAVKDVTVTAEETAIKSVNLGADIYDIISGDKDVYRVVTVKDTKDDVIVGKIGSAEGELALESTPANDNVTLEYVKKDAKGNWGPATEENAEAVAVKFAKDIDKTDSPLSVKVKVNQADGATPGISDELKVTVKEARKLDNITVEKTAVTAGINGTASFVVKAFDQYKAEYAASPEELATLKAVSTKSDSTLVIEGPDEVKEGEKVVGYKFTVTNKAVTNETVQVKIGETVKASVNVAIVEAADVVTGIAFEGENFNADGSYKYNLKDSSTIEVFNVVGKSAAGEVAIDPSKVVWTTSNDLITVVPATEDEPTKLQVADKENIKEDTVVTVTADLYGKKASVNLTVSKANGKLVANTLAVKDADKVDADTTKAGLQIALDGDNKDGEDKGAITLTFTGKDQYGEDLDGLDAVLAFKESVAKVTKETDKLTITAVGKGETQVRVTVDGVDFLIDVAVNDKAVEATKEQ